MLLLFEVEFVRLANRAFLEEVLARVRDFADMLAIAWWFVDVR